MSDVEFEEEGAVIASRHTNSKIIENTSASSGMARFLINNGIVGTEVQAMVLLLCLTLICLGTSGLVIWKNFYSTPNPLTKVTTLSGYTYQEDIPLPLRIDPRYQPQVMKLPSRNNTGL